MSGVSREGTSFGQYPAGLFFILMTSFKENPKIALNPQVGILLNRIPSCSHSNSFSSVCKCSCSFCNFLTRLFVFYKRNKCTIRRSSCPALVDESFDNCFNSSCFLYLVIGDISLSSVYNAASIINHRFSSEHACSLLNVPGIGPSTTDTPDCRSVCFNAQHLFECASISDQARGELFPVPRTGNRWHATCTGCGASCVYSTPREGLILSFFFRYLKFRYTGARYEVSLFCIDEWIHCSRHFTVTVLAMQGAHVDLDGIMIACTDPTYVHVNSSVNLRACQDEPHISYTTNLVSRFAKDDNVLDKTECGHSFYLTNAIGVQLKLSGSLLRTLLMLTPCQGYLEGETDISGLVMPAPNHCGIIAVGGLIGVNARCNQAFVDLHREFYSGPIYATPDDEILEAYHNAGLHPTSVHVTEKQSGTSSGEETEHAEEDFNFDETQALLANFNSFGSCVVDESVGISTRGLNLRNRIGGLVKGITNCVGKLHQVWDWPLDKAVEIANEVGDWLDSNEHAIDTTVFSCQSCPEVTRDLVRITEEQKKLNLIFQKTMEKLATTIDAASKINAQNVEHLEKKIEEIKSKMETMNNNPLVEEPSQAFVDALIDKVDSLEKRIDQNKAPRKRPVPNLSGEQMGIPSVSMSSLRNAKKQSPVSSVPDDLNVVGPSVSSEEVKGSRITSVGPSEEHNALLAKVYLGSITWSVSDGEGSILKDLHLPEVMWEVNSRMRNIVQYFQYYTCSGLEFTITTTSIGMQGGTLLIAWDALSCATKQKIGTVLQLSNLPFALLHASESATQIFTVESPAIQHIMCTSASEASIGELGTLKIAVANVLNASAETSQHILLNVWVKFLEPKLSFYTVRHELAMSQSAVSLTNLHGIDNFEAIVAQGKWSSTSGLNLVELTVHPTACHVANGLVTQTSLSVVSSLFNRWRGSMRFKIIFGASMFVKGKVIASAIPVAFRDRAMTIDEITSFPCTVCDLSTTTREFVFEVPYISVGQDSFVVRDSLYDVSSYNSEFVISRLHLVVLDPLVMNANASNDISYFITAGPGDDFELRDLTGVKAEFVDRTLKQSMADTLKSGKLLGNGFNSWCQRASVLRKFTLDSEKKNALHFMISPFYRSMPPCTTSLSWLSQLFVEWNGSLVYTLRAHSHDRTSSSYVRVWYDSNGSTNSGEEFEFLSEVDPPSGMFVNYWNPSAEPSIQIRVPFSARTRKLLLPKSAYTPTNFDWVRHYNGALVVDLEGDKSLSIEMSISAGEDFNMFEQTVAPRCGKVSKAFTALSYQSKLEDITIFPANEGRLGGPVNKAVVTPAKFAPVVPVVDDVPKIRKRSPQEGDQAFSEEGEPITYLGGEWVFDDEVTAQMNCFPSLTGIGEGMKELKERDTCSKIADIVDSSHSAIFNDEGTLSKLLVATKDILPILDTASKAMGSMEEKLATFEVYKSKIMQILKGALSSTIPGLVNSCIEHEQYTWATLITLLGGTSLLWVCKSKGSYIKKLSILMMITWSPFIVSKVWELGKWIKTKAFGFMFKKREEMCRKHSMAGMFEDAKRHLVILPSGFLATGKIQSLLSVLGVVASLVIWGSIPNEKKMDSFAARFKSFGEKGRSFSNIINGFNAINKTCSEWSKTFMGWILSASGSDLPKPDSALQALMDFNIRDWVVETRELSLQENRFTGFGGEEHLMKVRHLFDKSNKIQEALIDGCKVDVQLSLIIKECKDKCVELMNESYTFKGMKKPRIDPLHVCMIGAPGVGKSTISHVLINNLLDHRGEPEVDRIYTRCCADAYWSNYHQEPVVLYDDLGAIKSNLKLSDYAEIMGIKTNDPFSVPMAGVEDKGKHCTSKFVFSCTNVLELDDTGDVVTKAAYYRRRNVLVRVEKDPEVPRDENDPTKGLAFSVLGYSYQGRNNDRVVFDIKTEWNESFLANVDTTDWNFDRVEYKTFLKFLCTYTDAYMASQEKLLKGISSFKLDPFLEDEPVEAQAGKIISMSSLISFFDNHQLKGNDICAKLGNISPEGWKTSKVLDFNALISKACLCYEGDACGINHFMSLFSERVKHDIYKFVALEKIALDPMETTFVLKRDDIDKAEAISLLCYLMTVYKWSVPSGLCFFHFCQKQKKTDLKVGTCIDFDMDDRIPKEPTIKINGNRKLLVWESANRFFPRCYQSVQCVPIFDGTTFYALTSKDSDDPGPILANAWAKLWNEGLEMIRDPLQMFKASDRSLVVCLMNGITNFGGPVIYSEQILTVLKQAKELFGESGAYLSFVLYLAHCNSLKQKNGDLRDNGGKKKSKAFEAHKKLDIYEEHMEKGLGKKSKIALAVAGGVVAAGLVVGLFLGVKSIFSSIGGDVDQEPLDAQGSSCDGSDQYKTSFFGGNKKNPKVVIRTVDKQQTGAHESDLFKTPHVVRGRNLPTQRAIANKSFGVIYDDSLDLKRNIQLEKRKVFRKNVIQAISGKEESLSTIHANINAWQSKVIARGVLEGNDSQKVPLKKIQRQSQHVGKPEGEMLNGDPSFTRDDDVQNTLNQIVNMDLKDAPKMILNGMSTHVEKQAQVGSYGLTKDVNMTSLIESHITKMSCTILKVVKGTTDLYSAFNVLRLRGTCVLAPAHYLEEFHEDDELYFISPHKVVRFPFVPSNVSLVSNVQELIVWNLGNTVPPSTDFTVHIPRASDWDHFKKSSGVLCITKYNQDTTLTIVHTLDTIELTSADVEIPTGCYEMLDSSHTVISGLRYRVHCMPGFCGAAIVKADTRFVRKIVGMHVAGQRQKGVGYAETLSFEPIDEAIKRLCPRVVVQPEKSASFETCEKHSMVIEGKGNLGLIGVLKASAIPNVPAKTTVAKSMIHGLIGAVVSEPSILSSWDRRLPERGVWDPVIEGVKKYGTPTVPFKKEELDLVTEHLSHKFKNFENTLRKREVNNLEVGINGIDLSDFWLQMEMKTSAGYPYVLRKPAKSTGKSWLFKEVGKYPSGKPKFMPHDEEFILNLERMHEMIKTGISPRILTMECPKDERRKLSKIYDSPATRTFTILSPEVNILFRMYFGDFAAMVMTTRFDHFSQVGINPESMEWSEIMNSFLRIGKRGFAGDYAKFDGIGSAEIYHSITDVVNSWYGDGEENARARHALISSIVHRDGIAGSAVLRYSQGMPSGFAMTVIFNSFVNYYYMALAWMHIVSRSTLSPQCDLKSFDYYTRIIVYGDDNVVVVANDFLDVYNLRTVASYLSGYGITYTDDAKNPIHLSEPHVDITSVTFLKRSFVKVDRTGSLWKAPLDKSSIEERCNWIRECEEPVEALNQNIESALFEASIHGETYFEDLKSRLDLALDKVVLPRTSDTFRECQSRWWSNMTGAAIPPPGLVSLINLSKKNSIDLTFKFKDVLLGQEITLGKALASAKFAPMAYYSV